MRHVAMLHAVTPDSQQIPHALRPCARASTWVARLAMQLQGRNTSSAFVVQVRTPSQRLTHTV